MKIHQPVSGFSGIGEAQNGTKLQAQHEMEDEEGLLTQSAGHIPARWPPRFTFLGNYAVFRVFFTCYFLHWYPRSS